MTKTYISSPVDGRVVIVGSGHAGVELCAALRQRGFSGTIDVLGDDPALPYQRPPLSKEYMKRPEVMLALRPEQFYRDNAIQIRTGSRVVAIERAARQIRLQDGETLAYDHLVLATGARNFTPPIPGLETPHCLELRTLADAVRMSSRLPRLKRLAVIGGGFIGLEAAGLLAAMSREVEVVDIAPRLMQRAVSPATSDWFARFHREAGVKLHLECGVQRIDSRDDGVTLHLSSGETIDADAVLLAAGVCANDDLAAEAGLEVAGGIVVDARLATSDPSISAIGDCARFPLAGRSGEIRLESVQNAVDQARYLAGRLMGVDGVYAALPWFWSNQGDARLQIAGLVLPAGDEPVTTVLRGDPAGSKLSIFVYEGQRLLAVETINQSVDHMLARKILGRGDTIAPGQAGDPGFDLKSLAQSTPQALATV